MDPHARRTEGNQKKDQEKWDQLVIVYEGGNKRAQLDNLPLPTQSEFLYTLILGSVSMDGRDLSIQSFRQVDEGNLKKNYTYTQIRT